MCANGRPCADTLSRFDEDEWLLFLVLSVPLSHAHKKTHALALHACIAVSLSLFTTAVAIVSVSLPAISRKTLELLCWRIVAERTSTLKLKCALAYNAIITFFFLFVYQMKNLAMKSRLENKTIECNCKYYFCLITVCPSFFFFFFSSFL